MLSKIEKYAALHNMIECGDYIVAGISGGADSCALLHILYRLSKKMPLKLTAVHINHGIRGREAKSDEDFVKRICQEYGVECVVFSYDVPKFAAENNMTVEEAGRKLRYDAFFKTAGKDGKIAVAHNMNDNCETMLMRFFRGTGIKGLGGISPVRDNIIRPLLCVSRGEIEEYCKENALTYRTDSTNYSTDYTRNKIRLMLVPQIEKDFNSAIGNVMFRTAEIIRQENAYIEKQAKTAYDSCVCGKNKISIKKLNEYDTVLKRRIIRRALEPFCIDLHNVTFDHIESVLALTGKKSGKVVELPHNMGAVREFDAIRFYCGSEEVFNTNADISLEKPVNFDKQGFSFILTEHKRCDYIDEICLDYNSIANLDNIKLRTISAGDKIYLAGLGTKSVKKILAEKKLSPAERNKVLLLACDNDVIWIQNMKTSGRYKLADNSKKAVYIYIYK